MTASERTAKFRKHRSARMGRLAFEQGRTFNFVPVILCWFYGI